MGPIKSKGQAGHLGGLLAVPTTLSLVPSFRCLVLYNKLTMKDRTFRFLFSCTIILTKMNINVTCYTFLTPSEFSD